MDQNDTKDIDKAKFLIGAMKKLADLTKGTEAGKAPITMSDFMEYVIDSLEMLLAVGVEIATLRSQVGELLNEMEGDIKKLHGKIDHITNGKRL